MRNVFLKNYKTSDNDKETKKIFSHLFAPKELYALHI